MDNLKSTLKSSIKSVKWTKSDISKRFSSDKAFKKVRKIGKNMA